MQMLPVSARAKARWDALERPHYLTGVLKAAEQARREGVTAISAVEFGVAGGAGLLLLQDYAEKIEKETGIGVEVYGFDSGAGLPQFTGDYRDHPDRWIPGDYPMNESALRGRLGARSSLILGDVRDTVAAFSERASHAPIGFAALDLDLYSSTRAALEFLVHPAKRTLRRTILYFDDIDGFEYNKFAGERLAIEEFNRDHAEVKIDTWHGLGNSRAFPEAAWLHKMYIAHDLKGISASAPSSRQVRRL
jgi:hypothetical protein